LNVGTFKRGVDLTKFIALYHTHLGVFGRGQRHDHCFVREDTMSVGWMPWRCVPMKDVALLR
jgi:hypothetical protein